MSEQPLSYKIFGFLLLAMVMSITPAIAGYHSGGGGGDSGGGGGDSGASPAERAEKAAEKREATAKSTSKASSAAITGSLGNNIFAEPADEGSSEPAAGSESHAKALADARAALGWASAAKKRPRTLRGNANIKNLRNLLKEITGFSSSAQAREAALKAGKSSIEIQAAGKEWYAARKAVVKIEYQSTDTRPLPTPSIVQRFNNLLTGLIKRYGNTKDEAKAMYEIMKAKVIAMGVRG